MFLENALQKIHMKIDLVVDGSMRAIANSLLAHVGRTGTLPDAALATVDDMQGVGYLLEYRCHATIEFLIHKTKLLSKDQGTIMSESKDDISVLDCEVSDMSMWTRIWLWMVSKPLRPVKDKKALDSEFSQRLRNRSSTSSW